MRFPARLFGVSILFFATTPLFAQRPEALKHARAGFEYEQKSEYQYALFEYDTAAKLDPTYPYPVERTGGMYQVLKNYPKAIDFYERAVHIDSAFDVYNYYNLGLCFHVVQKYDSAVLNLKEFIRRMDPVNHADSVAMQDADWWIKFNLGCIVEAAKPKNTEEPVPLGEINSKYNDFAPSETADGSTLYFTSDRPGTNKKEVIEKGGFSEDIFVAHRDSLGHFSSPAPLPPPLNSLDDEGSATVTADGQTLYMSLCRRPGGVGDCDLYESQLSGNQWATPQNLGQPLNSPAWDAEPSVTADGSTLYFSSTRPGSIEGSEDIYVAYRNTDGSWTPPKNLGEPVNTRFNDRSPFISADGKTLYFSSNGHPGFGNHDLFMTRKLSDGTWCVPVNLGRPINAYGDDVFLTIPASGDKIIYSTQRADARASLHLYEAKLPLEFRPGPVTLIAGTVYDRVTHSAVAAEVDVNDLKTNQLVAVYHANKVTGKFYITLGTGKMYGITATASGYAPYSDHYTVPDTISYREVTHDLPLTPLPAEIAGNVKNPNENKNPKGNLNPNGNKKENRTPNGNKNTSGNKNPNEKKNPSGNLNPNGNIDTSGIELHNVFFDFDKSTLRPESHSELDYWVALLKKNPKLKIEIDGHTDSVGTAAYNLKLSLERARAVQEYLVDHGINELRLLPKGFGATRPKASNATEEGRQRNRRTEFRFIHKTDSTPNRVG
jgi:outer membrane protein OmpA-like peptidoglycan-associated protein